MDAIAEWQQCLPSRVSAARELLRGRVIAQVCWAGVFRSRPARCKKRLFCFLHLKRIEMFLLYVLNSIILHPWSVLDLRKREKILFLLPDTSHDLPPYCHLRSNALPCHPEDSFNKIYKARPEVFLAPGETKPNITTLTIKEQSSCLHKVERCSFHPSSPHTKPQKA